MRNINGHEYQHLFDGLALMQKLVIKSGNVTYTSRFLRSDSYTKNTKYNRIVVSEFGTRSIVDPCKSIFSRIQSYFTLDDIFTDNDLVSFYFIGDQLYAASDSPYIRRIDVPSLETLERVDLSNVVGVNTATSHPHTDSEGNTFNIGSNIGCYNITAFSKERGINSGVILAKIATKNPLCPSYYHSFLITPRYFIFIEQPLVISIASVVYQNRITNGVNSRILKWKPHLGSRFYIIDREKNQLLPQVYTADAFAFFHTINAYEEGDHVVCDVVTYKDASFLNTLYIDSIKSAQQNNSARNLQAKFLTSRADRFVLPLLQSSSSSSSCKQKQNKSGCWRSTREDFKVGQNVNRIIDSQAFACFKADGSIHCSPEHLTEEGEALAELPTINYKYYNGKPYKYFYGFARCKKSNSLGLMKVNTESKKYLTWFDETFYPSEAIFVAKPNGSLLPEDDGVLLSLVINLQVETNGFLLVLNAKNFTELARAYFDAADVVTPGFHGIFLPDERGEKEDRNSS